MPFFALYALSVRFEKPGKPRKAQNTIYFAFCTFAVLSVFLCFWFLIYLMSKGFGTGNVYLNYLMIPFVFIQCIFGVMFSLAAGIIMLRAKKGQPIRKSPFILSIIDLMCGCISILFPAQVIPSLFNSQWVDLLYLVCCAVVLFSIIDRMQVHIKPEDIEATKV